MFVSPLLSTLTIDNCGIDICPGSKFSYPHLVDDTDPNEESSKLEAISDDSSPDPDLFDRFDIFSFKTRLTNMNLVLA